MDTGYGLVVGVQGKMDQRKPAAVKRLELAFPRASQQWWLQRLSLFHKHVNTCDSCPGQELSKSSCVTARETSRSGCCAIVMGPWPSARGTDGVKGAFTVG